jgi:predicted acyltransferase
VNAPAPRFASLDVLRGAAVAAMLLVNDPGDWSHVPAGLEHSAWNGCTVADLVFPFFLFIVGVSLSLARGAQQPGAEDRGAATATIVLRGLRLVALGLVLSALRWALIADGHAYRPMGILQRIGICYSAAGLIALNVRSTRLQWLLLAAVLVGYWLVLAADGPLLPGLNLADRVDSALLGAHAYAYDPASGAGRDPEGLLSTLPAVATVLLGVRAGDWLRRGQTRALLGSGLASLVLGAAWAGVFPLNKQLWSSSFVLWTAGMAFLALAVAHELFDVRRWPAIGRSLGVNAIAAYAGSWAMVCVLEGSGLSSHLYRTVFAMPLGPRLPPWVPSLAYALAFTALWWALMAWATRRGWRLTI